MTFPAAAGTPITWTATATGGTQPLQYQFWIDVPGVGWTLARDYAAANTLLWTPSAGGDYRIQVWARNNGSAAPYDAVSTVVSFSITGTAAIVVSNLAADVPLPAAAGTPITWTATATGGTAPLQYQFWIDVPGVGWILARDYGAANTLLWTPSAGGDYRIQVWARNNGSAAPYDAVSTVVSFSITGTAAIVVSNLAADVPLPAAAGTPITWTATATGGTAPLQYQFWVDTPGLGWVPQGTVRARQRPELHARSRWFLPDPSLGAQRWFNGRLRSVQSCGVVHGDWSGTARYHQFDRGLYHCRQQSERRSHGRQHQAAGLRRFSTSSGSTSLERAGRS